MEYLFYIRYNSILNSENNIKNGTTNTEEWKEKEKKNLKVKKEEICNIMKKQLEDKSIKSKILFVTKEKVKEGKLDQA